MNKVSLYMQYIQYEITYTTHIKKETDGMDVCGT